MWHKSLFFFTNNIMWCIFGLHNNIILTFSPAQRSMTLEDERPLDRHASGDRNVKF